MKMKRFFSLFLMSTLLCISTLPISAASASPASQIDYTMPTQTTIEYLPDGSCFVTVIETQENSVSLLSTTTTKAKTSTYYGADGKSYWAVTVTGTFTYGNGTSKCTSSSVSAKSYDTNSWRIASKSASRSGNKATATASAKQYQSGKYLQTVSKTVTLTCSSTGKFS